MYIDALDEYSDDGYWEESSGVRLLSNGMGVALFLNEDIQHVAALIANAIQTAAWQQPKIDHFTRGDGRCPRFHRAFHVYHQDPPFEPIRLCDEKFDVDLQGPCPFEYYTFLRMLQAGNSK